MRIRYLFVGVVFSIMISFGAVANVFGEEEEATEIGFSPEVYADYIHAIIAADRTLDNTTHVVDPMQIRIASLWPLFVKNGPATVFEETGLKVVAENPDEVYSGIVTRGNTRIFKAIYADKAVSQSCVDCHNDRSRARAGRAGRRCSYGRRSHRGRC